MCAGHQQHPSITVLFQRARVAVQVQIQNIQKEKEGERKPPPHPPLKNSSFGDVAYSILVALVTKS